MDETGINPLPALPREMDLEGANNSSATHTDISSRPGGPSRSKRKELLKEQWEDLKPLIRRLYLDENMTREAVTKCIVQEYNFEPTRRQFLRKISEWGFEKNVKKAERKAILLNTATSQNSFETRIIHGRKLDKAKIERWSKRDGIPMQHQELAESKVEDIQFSTDADDFPSSSPDAETDVRTTHIPSGEEMDIDPKAQHVAIDVTADFFNPWAVVDVVGSPQLTGLIGALAICECDSLSLDLSPGAPNPEEAFESMEETGEPNAAKVVSCSSTSTEIVSFEPSTRKKTFPTIPKWVTQNKPHIGISPFPTSAAHAQSPSYDLFASKRPPRLSESECKAKMRRLSKTKPADVLALVDDMWSIACRYYSRRDYRAAESWYRRIVTAKLHVRHLRQHETLEACLKVVACIDYQGRYAEARAIHQDLHEKILRLFKSNPDHELTVTSRERLARIFSSFGEREQGEAIRRELLQLALNKYGLFNRRCLFAMHRVASCLRRTRRYSQAEQLYHTILHIKNQLLGYSPSHDTHKMGHFKDEMMIVKVLNRTARYSEAEILLRHIQERHPDSIAVERETSFKYHCELGYTRILQGRLDESEKILRRLLQRQENFLTPSKRADLMSKLAGIAEKTSRMHEAASWYKKKYILEVETYGFKHKYSLESCGDLGKCYADQGLFQEAIIHFQQAEAQLARARGEGNEDEHGFSKSIERIQRWTSYVVDDSMANWEKLGFDYVERGSFDEAILHFQEAIGRFSNTMDDANSTGAYNGCIGKLNSWLSTTYALKSLQTCWDIGRGFTDGGHFDKAILHFQHAIDRIDHTEENGTHGPDECIEILQYWIRQLEQEKAEFLNDNTSVNSSDDSGQDILGPKQPSSTTG
ncbi:hypothetical protein DL95DRAFT_521876 [Leptodontidium sp. 2 PMI_412]|nr:hypothetical protein DL95DRAFT_521876 [Leptodontidium sp. 2 PMI_412]